MILYGVFLKYLDTNEDFMFIQIDPQGEFHFRPSKDGRFLKGLRYVYVTGTAMRRKVMEIHQDTDLKKKYADHFMKHPTLTDRMIIREVYRLYDTIIENDLSFESRLLDPLPVQIAPPYMELLRNRGRIRIKWHRVPNRKQSGLRVHYPHIILLFSETESLVVPIMLNPDGNDNQNLPYMLPIRLNHYVERAVLTIDQKSDIVDVAKAFRRDVPDNRYCLVFSPVECIYFEKDGRRWYSDQAPDYRLSSKTVFE